MKSILRNFLVILPTASLSINYSFASKHDDNDLKNNLRNKSHVPSHADYSSSTTKKLMDAQLNKPEFSYSFYKNPKNQKNDDKDGEGKNTSKSIVATMKYKF